MKIIVDISQDVDGRAVGTVRAADDPQVRSFSGNLEFLAVVESLYLISADDVGDKADRIDEEPS